MGDVISLFHDANQASGQSYDLTLLAFTNIEDLCAMVRPHAINAALNGGDQIMLRILNIVAQELLDPSRTDDEAKVGGWTSLDVQRGKGYDILCLVNDLWNEAIAAQLSADAT